MLEHTLVSTGARVIACDRAAEGMGASLACGVAAAADADGWIVALADMPWIAPTSIVAVADALRDGAEIAAAHFEGKRGHPVGFAKKYGPLLASLTGDAGARSVIAARQWALQLVEVDDPGVLRDVDRRSDLA
jgi:molybdenum cofactor cytidylyltransferase